MLFNMVQLEFLIYNNVEGANVSMSVTGDAKNPICLYFKTLW